MLWLAGYWRTLGRRSECFVLAPNFFWFYAGATSTRSSMNNRDFHCTTCFDVNGIAFAGTFADKERRGDRKVNPALVNGSTPLAK